MINVSELFSSKIAESTRQFSTRLMCGTEEIIGAIKSVQITSGACSESDFTVGAVFSSYIEVVIDKCEDILEDKELLLQIGLLVDDDTVEYADIGYYTVTKPKTSAYSTTFTAVGRITSKLNKIFDVPEVLTLRNIANAITAATGVNIVFNGEVSDAVLGNDVTGMTCKEALFVIAATFGGFATEDNAGNIVVSKYNTDSKVAVNGDRMTAFPEFNDLNYQLSGIKVVVSAESVDEDGNVIEEVAFTEGTPRLIITNEFMTADLFESFVANTVGYTFRPGVVPLALGDPRLEPWDCLKVTDVKGNVHIVPCLNIVHTFDGGLSTTITAPGESESESSSSVGGSITQQLKGLEVALLSIQEAIVKRLKAEEILTEDIKAATGEFTKYLKGVKILAEQIDVDGLFAKDIEATGSVKGLTFISEGTPDYNDIPPELAIWLKESILKASGSSLILKSGTEGENDYMEAISTAFGTKYRVYLSEGPYGGTEEAVLYTDSFGIKFMTRQYDETEFETLFKLDFDGVSWKGSQLINRAELTEILNELTGGGSIVLEETDPTVPAWAKEPTKPTYTASEVGARPSTWTPTAEEVGARPNTWTPSASDVGADSEGTAESKVSEHNTNVEAHNDIRLLIEGLSTRLNTLADSDDTTLDQTSELVAYIKSNRSLIEEVTTNKVNVSDIIDNLTTNVANKPLAAAQGVAIKALIDALSQSISALSTGKADKATTLAGYGITDGAKKDDVDALQTGFDNHTSDTDKHITAEERTAWNGKASQEDFEEHSEWTHRAVDEIVAAVTEHRTDDSSHITEEERDTWNAKLNEEDIPKKYSDLEDDIGTVRTVNYIAPDENGNVNVEGGSGTESNAFEVIKNGALVWNGNTEGRSVVPNSVDPTSLSYVRVTSVVPTLEELQKGGTWATTDSSGIEYEETFTSDNIVDNGTVISCCDGYILVAKEDNVQYTEGTDISCTLPLAGVYFVYFGDEGYTSKFTITNYTAFTTSILKMESLTVHGHDWYGTAMNSGNTARGDDTIHGGFVKVADAVPTEAEVRNGGIIRRYDVADNSITGELIVENYLESPYSIASANGEILIAREGVAMVQIKADGVYFKQDENDCIHSLTINGYSKFSYNVEKIPFELIPEGIGGGVTSWNDLPDKPFGETTATSDTLTWDGSLDENDINMIATMGAILVKLSDATPTLEDLAGGGIFVNDGNTFEFTHYIDSGGGMLMAWNDSWEDDDTSMLGPLIVSTDVSEGELGEGIPAIPKGIYAYYIPGMIFFESCTFNNYQLVTTEIKILDDKYLPEPLQLVDIPAPKTLADNPTLNFTRDGGTWASLLYSGALNMDSSYTVIYNGVEYKDLVPTQSYNTITVKPNDSIWNISYSPDFLGVTLLYVNTPEDSEIPSVTITLIESSVTKKGINIESLPESHQFGGSVTKTNTLTWDGVIDEDDIDMTATMGACLVKLSDSTPTVEDLAGGGTCVNNGTAYEFTHYSDSGNGMLMAMNDSWEDADTAMFCPVIISTDMSEGALGDGVPAIPKGTYAYYVPTVTNFESCTFNSCTFTVDNIKYIDNKYLEPFETVEVGTDTLTWDGNTDGLYTPGNARYLVSEAVPSYEELSAGVVVDATTVNGRESITQTTSTIIDKSNDQGTIIMVSTYLVIVTKANGTDTYGTVYEKPGVYFAKAPMTDFTLQIHSLTINGYTGFTEEQTKLKEEYLPKDEIADYVISKLAVWEGGSY